MIHEFNFAFWLLGAMTGFMIGGITGVCLYAVGLKKARR